MTWGYQYLQVHSGWNTRSHLSSVVDSGKGILVCNQGSTFSASSGCSSWSIEGSQWGTGVNSDVISPPRGAASPQFSSVISCRIFLLAQSPVICLWWPEILTGGLHFFIFQLRDQGGRRAYRLHCMGKPLCHHGSDNSAPDSPCLGCLSSWEAAWLIFSWT